MSDRHHLDENRKVTIVSYSGEMIAKEWYGRLDQLVEALYLDDAKKVSLTASLVITQNTETHEIEARLEFKESIPRPAHKLKLDWAPGGQLSLFIPHTQTISAPPEPAQAAGTAPPRSRVVAPAQPQGAASDDGQVGTGVASGRPMDPEELAEGFES